jgi:M6 family metalloprotease-like protein
MHSLFARCSPQFRIAALICAAALSSAADVNADASLQFGPPYVSTGSFLRPYGLAIDTAHGRLLVADTGNHRFKWTTAASVNGPHTYTEFGFVADRTAPEALTDPQGIAVDAAGNVYVANTLTGNVKWYAWNGGNYQTASLLCPTNAHTVDGIDIQMPRDIAVGPDGAIYLLDSGNHRILKADGPADPDWSVFVSDPSWNNPYGLTVDATGVIFLADSGNHRVLKIQNGVTVATWGHFGIGAGEFRYPRDVAVDQFGRVFVADTYNHRIAVLAADGHSLINLGHAPGVGTLEKVAIDQDGRLFAVDSDNNQVLAFLGGGTPPPFDPFFRDYVGDPGSEPSNALYTLSSPDILVRHQPDVDLATAAAAGLESYAFQQPHFDENNYVYVTLRNRGTQPAADNFVKLFWYDPGSPSKFPADWKNAGFYTAYVDAAHNTPGNTLAFGLVPTGGVVVGGPIIWRPPAPASNVAHDGQFRLAVRVTNPHDSPPVGNSTTMPRDSNDVAERPLTVLSGPFATGTQNTLVLRVHFSDLAAQTDQATVEARAQEMADWVKEVSYGEADVTLLHRGPITPAQPSTHYAQPDNSVVVELAQDVLDKLVQAEPTVLDGSGPGHEISRIVLVTNDLASTTDMATTGNWPYTVNGQTRYISCSVQGGNNSAALFEHGMSHQLSLVDLYAYANVTFPRPYADGWDTMAKPINGVHPFVWSKEHGYWVTSHDSKIFYIPRPAAGTTWNNGGTPIGLNVQTTAAPGQTVGVAFGLTNGVTTFTDETAFYYVEARAKTGADATVPQAGVIMYYANSLVPQGQGPVIMRDHVPGGTLNDAAIPVGGSESPAGTGIKVTVQAGTAGADFNLAVEYNPPATDYDVFMHPGDPPWTSPDIWVDNQKDGYDLESNRSLEDRGNQGIAGEENRIYARVYNSGPATANDVEVAFLLSEPYHTVGDAGSFDELKSVFIDAIPSGQNVVSPFVTWTPATGIDPHTCARVELRKLFNDTNSANNWAQRNLQIDHSVHGSPYTAVEFPFMVRNDEPTPQLTYFRADGVPTGWTWSIAPKKALIAAGGTTSGLLKLQPPDTAPDCTSHKMYVSGWAARGDTLVRLGGTTLTVQLQRKTRIDLRTALKDCQKGDRTSTRGRGGNLATHTLEPNEKCLRLVTVGCTAPKQPNQKISVRYEGPDGKPIYHEVMTDANGCFEDFDVVTEGGPWQADVEYEGNLCQGPARASSTIDVPLPKQEHPDEDPDEGRACLIGLSQNVNGVVQSAREESARSQCKTSAVVDPVELKLVASGGFNNTLFDGEIMMFDLRHVLLSHGRDAAGFNRGRFQWKSASGSALGTVDGLTNVGTHHKPALLGAVENSDLADHWELSLQGIVVEGAMTGARIAAVLVIDVDHSSPQKSVVTGTLEGVVKKMCDLDERAVQRRVAAAHRLVAAPPSGQCPEGLPCLARISKAGEGETVLDQTAHTGCRGKSNCETLKTWSRLTARLKGTPGVESSPHPLADGTFTIKELLQAVALDQNGRGEHSGRFEYVAADGTTVEGLMTGVSTAGSHRKPARMDLEHFDQRGHLEGRLFGRLTSGKSAGSQMIARYVVQISEEKGRRSRILINVDGWLVAGCIDSPEAKLPETERPPIVVVPPEVPSVRPKPVITLPEGTFRSITQLPPEVVERFRAAEGGKLSAEAEIRLRIADRQFTDIDRNSDGTLDKSEFSVLFTLSPEAKKKRDEKAKSPPSNRPRSVADYKKLEIEALDTDKDGKLSAEELRDTERVSRELAFKRADVNGDQKIDLTEFVLWSRTLPRVERRAKDR